MNKQESNQAMTYNILPTHEEKILEVMDMTLETAQEARSKVGPEFELVSAVTVTEQGDKRLAIEELSYSSVWQRVGEIVVAPHIIEFEVDGQTRYVRQVGVWHKDTSSSVEA